ncbi:MAG: hypothetical protein AAF479_02615 [Pseudomonadota bacterium]
MQNPNPVPPTPPEREPNARPTVQFDWRDWLPYLAASGAPEDQKRELIETVWAIVLTFVDLGWDVEAVSETSEKTCGQNLDLTAALMSAVVQSDHSKLPDDTARPHPIDPETEDAA